jgi:RNA-splicing ligase RtcB
MRELDSFKQDEKEKRINLAVEGRKIKNTLYYNFSGQNLQEIFRYFPRDLKAEKVVLLPDLCPGKAPLPTGCAVEVNRDKQPNWRKFAISDIGCGIRVEKSKLNWLEFEENLKLWDEVMKKIKENKGKLGDLGSGNHFLDAAVDNEERIYFVIHTGSRSESSRVDKLTDKPRAFDKVYSETVLWAKNNREAIADILEKIYGKLELILDKSHNSYEIKEKQIVIRKGAVKLEPNELTIIPSTMNGDMVLVRGKNAISEVLSSMAHGTGRIKSRGESKKDAYQYNFKNLREQIYIPEEISDDSILTENPSCYRQLDSCLALIKNLVKEEKRLIPVAYIGQI